MSESLTTSWQLVEEVLQLAGKAAEQILSVYYSSNEYIVRLKEDDTPVTMADQLSNRVLTQGLMDLTPGAAVISEESIRLPYEERKNLKSFWLVDPLDGTKEFIKRNGEFSINLGLLEGNSLVLGIVSIPVREVSYVGLRGAGAWRIKGSEKVRLQADRFSRNGRQLKIACSRSHVNRRTHEYLDRFDSPELVPAGSALKFMLLAEGAVDVYPRLGPTMEWDSAAAQLILEEAGGRVVDIRSGESLVYNKTSLYNPEFLALGNTDSLDWLLLDQ